MHEIVAYRIQLLKETSGEKSCAGHKYIQTIAGNIINIIYFIPIIYFNVLILILSIYILFQWGNLLGFPIFYARFQVNQNVSSVKLCF